MPGQFAEISRPDKCKIKFLDYYGEEKILQTEGLLATCIQHEMDHLEGILFIDYLSKLKKDMIVKKLSKQKIFRKSHCLGLMAYEILFMGTPEFSVPILKCLNSKHKILSVYTQPPKKKFRGQKIVKSPIHLESEKLKLPIRFPENLNNNEEYKFIKESKAKFVIVVAYGQIIPENFLNTKNLIFLNIHASLLPRWRGAAPIQRSIIEMDKETGITIMKIIPKLDAGPYILQKKIVINDNDNFAS